MVQPEIKKIILKVYLIALIFIFICQSNCECQIPDQNLKQLTDQGVIVVTAREIFSKIAAGEPVRYTNVVICEDIDINDLQKIHQAEINRTSDDKNLRVNEKTINSQIIIDNSEIYGIVTLNDSIFNEAVIFRNTNFYNFVSLYGSTFENYACFSFCTFPKNYYLDFREVKFKGDADFWMSNLGFIDFSHSLFNSRSFFESTSFNGANFGNSIFNGPAFFDFAEFNGSETLFSRTKFNSIANFVCSNFASEFNDFSNAEFNGITHFNIATFNGETSFKNALFTGPIYFNGHFSFNDAQYLFNNFYKYINLANRDVYQTESPQYAWRVLPEIRSPTGLDKLAFEDIFINSTFGFLPIQPLLYDRIPILPPYIEGINEGMGYIGARFKGVSDFRKTRFISSVSLVGAQFENDIYFYDAIFENKLNLTDSIFETIIIEWKSIDDSIICNDPVYLMLINNFKNLGRLDDAIECYYSYRKYKQDNLNFGATKLIDMISWALYGYGVRPGFSIIWSMISIFLFGMIYYVKKCLIKSNCPYIDVKKGSFETASKSTSMYFSALVFSHSHPPLYWHPSGNWKYLVLVEDIIGWLLLGLFIVALINVTVTW